MGLQISDDLMKRDGRLAATVAEFGNNWLQLENSLGETVSDLRKPFHTFAVFSQSAICHRCFIAACIIVQFTLL